MTNGKLLKATIVDHGVKVRWLCRKLNISEETFRGRLIGRTDFTVGEMVEITRLLRLTEEEKNKIFCLT